MIRQDETSDFMTTAIGCDQVEKHLPSHQVLYRLLKASEDGTSPADVDAGSSGRDRN